MVRDNRIALQEVCTSPFCEKAAHPCSSRVFGYL